MAMLVIGMVAAGILAAFVAGRRITLRSSSELQAMGFVEEIHEQLRSAPLPNGITLQAGIYVDGNMLATARPEAPNGTQAQVLPALNFPNDPNRPDEFADRFLTNEDRSTAQGTLGRTWANHADGRVYVVEDAQRAAVDLNGDGDTEDPGEPALSLADVDLDGDGLAGIDFNGDRRTDLRRVRVRVRFTTPEAR